MKTRLLPTLGLQDITRSGHVTRWHSVRTMRQQTLAEHHYLVAMFTNKLAKDILGDKITDTDRLQLIEYAMWHDTPELITGDLPSPLKRRIEQICHGRSNPLDQIEEQVAPWLIRLQKDIKKKPEQAMIVKLADMIDAVLFIQEEGVGKHALAVAQKLRDSLDEKIEVAKRQMPQFPWDIVTRLLVELLSGQDKQIAFEGN